MRFLRTLLVLAICFNSVLAANTPLVIQNSNGSHVVNDVRKIKVINGDVAQFGTGTAKIIINSGSSFQTHSNNLDRLALNNGSRLNFVNALKVAGLVPNEIYNGTIFNTAFATKTTDNLTQGSINKYYSNLLFNGSLATKSTTNLTEGTNLYYTQLRANGDALQVLNEKIGVTVQGHSNNLDFLALNNGSRLNFVNALKLGGQVANEIYNGSIFNTAFATKSTTNLSEGTNLYYTALRANGDSLQVLNEKIGVTVQPHSANLDLLALNNGSRLNKVNALTLGNQVASQIYNGSIFNTAFETRTDSAIDINGNVIITGNIGIGYLNPSSALAVNGTAQITGFKMSSGASNGYVLTTNGGGLGTWKELPVSGSGTVTNVSNADEYLSIADQSTIPTITVNHSLIYNGSIFNTAFATKSTTDLVEGNNLYYTIARANGDAAQVVAEKIGSTVQAYSANLDRLALNNGAALTKVMHQITFTTDNGTSISPSVLNGTVTTARITFDSSLINPGTVTSVNNGDQYLNVTDGTSAAIVTLQNGALQSWATKARPSSVVVGTTDTQTLLNKTLNGSVLKNLITLNGNTLSIPSLTQGDILYSKIAGSLTRLAKGTNHYRLTTNGNTLAWESTASPGNNLSFFAATTSAQLAGVLSDEVGTGKFLLNGTPLMSSATLNKVTTINGNTMSLPALTQGDMLYSKIASSITRLPKGTNHYRLATNGNALAWESTASPGNNLSFFSATTSAQLAGVLSDEVGTGKFLLNGTPLMSSATLNKATVFNGTTLSIPALTQGSLLFAKVASGLVPLTKGTNHYSLKVNGNALAWEQVPSGSGSVSGTNTGDQTITLTNDVTGSGTGSFAVTIGANKVLSSMINNATIAAADFSVGAVTSSAILNGAIATADIASSITLTTPVIGAATGTSLVASGRLIAGSNVNGTTANFTKVLSSGTVNGTTGIFTGNVGIGQFAPSSKLVVNGTTMFKAATNNRVVTLTDTATPALDASLGNLFTLTATGDRTIAVPTNGTDGQKITIKHVASGGARTLALNTGAGGFRYGSDITGLTQTASGKSDYVGAIYNATDSRWDVVSVIKGF